MIIVDFLFDFLGKINYFEKFWVVFCFSVGVRWLKTWVEPSTWNRQTLKSGMDT